MNPVEEIKIQKIKGKALTAFLKESLLNDHSVFELLLEWAEKGNDSGRATLLEAFQEAWMVTPGCLPGKAAEWAVHCLNSEAPRQKWEAARLIALLAPFFPEVCRKAEPALLVQAVHSGTVVRWSAAGALVALLLLPGPESGGLEPIIRDLLASEEKTSIKKIYQAGLKKRAKGLNLN